MTVFLESVGVCVNLKRRHQNCYSRFIEVLEQLVNYHDRTVTLLKYFLLTNFLLWKIQFTFTLQEANQISLYDVFPTIDLLSKYQPFLE